MKTENKKLPYGGLMGMKTVLQGYGDIHSEKASV
jgi:hypothetical protein